MWIKSWSVCIFAVCLAVSAPSDERKVLGEVVSEVTRFDFGEVPPETTVGQVVKVRNPSDRDVTIDQSVIGCGCLRLGTKLPVRIPAMGSADFELFIDATPGRYGEFRYGLELFRSDPLGSPLKFAAFDVQYRSSRELMLDPERLIYLVGESATEQLKRVRLMYRGASPFKIVGLSGASAVVRLHVDEVVGRLSSGGRVYSLELDLSALHPARDRLTVGVLTDSDRYPLLEVPIEVARRGAIEVTPPDLKFGLVRDQNPRALRLNLVSTRGPVVRVEVESVEGVSESSLTVALKGAALVATLHPEVAFRDNLTVDASVVIRVVYGDQNQVARLRLPLRAVKF